MITIKEELWADKDGNPVPFGDVRGRRVLAGVGSLMSEADALKYGVIKPEPEPEVKAVPAAPENKAVAKKATK